MSNLFGRMIVGLYAVLTAHFTSANGFSRVDPTIITPAEYSERHVAFIGPENDASNYLLNRYDLTVDLPPITGYVSNWGQFARNFYVDFVATYYDKLILSEFGMCGTLSGDETRESEAIREIRDVCKHLKAKDFEVVTSNPHGDMATNLGGFLTEADLEAAGNPQYEGDHAELAKRWHEGQNRVGGMLGAMKKLKETNPHLEIGMSIGGFELSEPFSRMVANKESRSTFINSIIRILKMYPFFTQININWLYPKVGGQEANSRSEKDWVNYAILIRELHTQLKCSAESKFISETKVVIGVSANLRLLEGSKLLNFIANGVDHIHLLTYDFFGSPHSPTLEHHTNLFHHRKDQLSVSKAVEYVRDVLKVPAELIHIGFVGFSRNARSATIDKFSPLTGSYEHVDDGNLVGGSYEDGVYEYYDVVDNFTTATDRLRFNKLKGFHLYTDEVVNADYIYNKESKFYMSFETPRTAYMKALYAKKEGLGGLFNCLIDYDDLGLLNSAREGLGYSIVENSDHIMKMHWYMYTCGVNVEHSRCKSMTDSLTHTTETSTSALRTAAESEDDAAASCLFQDPLADRVSNWRRIIYADTGTLVSHNNLVWKSKWPAKSDQEPGKHPVWDLVSETPTAWSMKKPYEQNTLVTDGGLLWKANSWSLAEKPGSKIHNASWHQVESNECSI